MQFKPVAQNILEWVALQAGLVPTPLGHAHFGYVLSKVVLEATDQGIFEAIGKKRITFEQVVELTGLNNKALKSILGLLASIGLINYDNSKFSLTGPAKKWLLKDSRHSLYWLLLFDNRVCFKWMEHVGTFLKTGEGLQYHNTFNEEEWFLYQKAMFVTASTTSKEAARKIPVPAGAQKMLDIGGSHGLYSAELCNRHPTLYAEVLDLPEAITQSREIYKDHPLQKRISFTEGNILHTDIGLEEYDLVLMASVAHHLTADENELVAQKAYRSLKPGGFFCIIEIMRKDQIQLGSDVLSGAADFFFALSSTSGAWSEAEVRKWQTNAGFVVYPKKGFLTIPGYACLPAQKPSAVHV